MVVLIIFPVILQTVINFRTLSIGGQGPSWQCISGSFATTRSRTACWT